MNPEYRRAALIATAVTVPIVVLALLGVAALNGAGNSPSTPAAPPPLTFTAPPQAAAQAGPCAKVLAELPVQLGSLAPRVVHTRPDTPDVVAWGDPAVVLECGVDRPAALHPGSSEEVFNAGDAAGPYYLVGRRGDGNVYTIIDRQPYIAITIPAKYQAATILPALVGAVGKGLPTAVCSTDPATPDPAKLCTRRRS